MSDITDLIQDLTWKKMEKEWLGNFGENFQQVRSGHRLDEIPKQGMVPAIVLGAGPSIQHVDLDLLRKWRGVLVTCDRMLIPLLQRRIVPYAVVTVDASEKIVPFYKDPLVEENIHRIKIVLSQNVHPEVLKCVPEASRYFYIGMWDNPLARFSLTRAFHLMTGQMMMETGGNAGTAAFYLAAFLLCEPIALLGLDFAYEELDPTKTTYFETFKIITGGSLEQIQKYYHNATTVRGKHVLTDEMFLVYAKKFAPVLQHFKQLNRHAYNLGQYSLLDKDVAEPSTMKKYFKQHNPKVPIVENHGAKA